MKCRFLSLIIFCVAVVSCAPSEFNSAQQHKAAVVDDDLVARSSGDSDDSIWNPSGQTDVNGNPVATGGDPFINSSGDIFIPPTASKPPKNPTNTTNTGAGDQTGTNNDTSSGTGNQTGTNNDTSSGTGNQTGSNNKTSTGAGNQTGSNNGTTTSTGNQNGTPTGTGTHIGGQTNGGVIDSQSGKACTEGDFVNFKYPTNIQNCLNRGKLWNFLTNSCSVTRAYKSGCSWNSLMTLMNSPNYKNSTSAQYINLFKTFRNEGSKLTGCAKADSKGVAIFQVIRGSFNKTTCKYNNESIQALCAVKDARTVPANIRNNAAEIVKWCMRQG